VVVGVVVVVAVVAVVVGVVRRQNELLCSTWLGMLARRYVYPHFSAGDSSQPPKTMFLNLSFFNFSESYWEPHFSYGLGRPSTCYQSCDSTKFIKMSWNQI
jgi:hypothetical protein